MTGESSSHDCRGGSDGGSDESIMKPKTATEASKKGIGKRNNIKPVTMLVALRNRKNPDSFQFSRSYTIPRLILHLSAGQLALTKAMFLVSDDDLAEEDLLIGLPLLRHLGIDSRTMLENNRSQLHGTDCSDVRTHPP